MLMSEHVYCVAMALKMTQQVEQHICINFCIKLEHFLVESIWMIQKATAMGNWWLAASLGKCTWHSKSSRWLSPLQPRFGTLQLPAFPKTKLPLKGKWFQTVDEIQENMTGQLMAIGRTAWAPKVPSLKGTEASLSYIQWFLYLFQ